MNAVRYHEESAEELLAEIRYLEVRAQGLGRRFLEEVKRGESHIVQFPEAGEEVRPGIRKRLLELSDTRSSILLSRKGH